MAFWAFHLLLALICLISLEEKHPSLQKVDFRCAVDAGKILAIIVGAGDVPRILGHGGRIIKALSEAIGKKVRILEYGVDDRKFLEDLFAPLSILTINTIWLPDGTTETRVILKKRRRARLPFNPESLKLIVKKVRNMSLRIEFTE